MNSFNSTKSTQNTKHALSEILFSVQVFDLVLENSLSAWILFIDQFYVFIFVAGLLWLVGVLLCDWDCMHKKRAAILLQVEHRQTRDVYISLCGEQRMQSAVNAENILCMQLHLV